MVLPDSNTWFYLTATLVLLSSLKCCSTDALSCVVWYANLSKSAEVPS